MQEDDNEENNAIIEPTPPKTKKPYIFTEARQKAWANTLLKREANNKLRKDIKTNEQVAVVKLIENRIVEKAISIKKREIKKQQVINMVEDDDTPMEEINEIIKSKTPPPRKPNKSTLSKIVPEIVPKIVFL